MDTGMPIPWMDPCVSSFGDTDTVRYLKIETRLGTRMTAVRQAPAIEPSR